MSTNEPKNQESAGSTRQSALGEVSTLDGERITAREHLTKRAPSTKSYKAEKSREFFCRDCGNRVTVAVSRPGEWGHELDCDHHVIGGVFQG